MQKYVPQVLIKYVAQHTGFLSQFTHVSDSSAYVEDLDLSLSAVLLAEACNIGLTPVIHPEIPALTRDRLSWVRHYFLRAETITRANACLVQAQRDIPLAQIWGGGYVASVDGLRFVVPVRSINTGPNPRYFGQGRGVYVTWNWRLWYHWNIKRTWRGHADIHRSRIHRVVPLSRAC